jgi:alpha-maltose-1-phosphate synthase
MRLSDSGRIRTVRVCHPFGNPNSYNAAVAFLEHGLLRRFHTLLYQPLGAKKRYHPDLPRTYVTTYPLNEVVRLAATQVPSARWNGRRQGFVDWNARHFDRQTANALTEGDGAVYCYEDSAAFTFERARDVGAKRIYELPTLYFRDLRRLIEAEISREPELACFFRTLREPAWKLERKDRELETADVIVVPTLRVRRSVEQFLRPAAQYVLAPYGSDLHVRPKEWTSVDQQGPLKLFAAGNLGPGKGLHILFAALARLGTRRYHLSLAGRWEPGFRTWLGKKYPIDYEWLGQLPHAEVYEACRRSHVFVFPSLAEGFGLVILEAMAAGIPVIASDQTAAPEIIQQGEDGWVVPAADSESLQTSLEAVLGERTRLPDIGSGARRKAVALDWASYRANLSSKVSHVLGGSPDCEGRSF